MLVRPGIWTRHLPCDRPVALSTERTGRRLIRCFDCSFQATETHSSGTTRFLSFDSMFKPFCFWSLLLHCIFMLFLELIFKRQLLEHFFPTPFVLECCFNYHHWRNSLFWPLLIAVVIKRPLICIHLTQWPAFNAFAGRHTIKQQNKQTSKNKQTKKQVFFKTLTREK